MVINVQGVLPNSCRSAAWLAIAATPTITYSNGDEARYIDHTFRCRYISGEPRPDQEETTDVRWFPVDDMPEMKSHFLERIEAARDETGPTKFRQNDEG